MAEIGLPSPPFNDPNPEVVKPPASRLFGSVIRSSIINAVEQRLQQDFSRPYTVVTGIINSRSATYPFRGIQYFFAHPKLWPMFIRMIPPILIINLAVFSSIFSTLFSFNTVLSIACCGPLGLFVGIGLTLQESNFITSYILNNYLVPKPMNTVFDYILCQEGLDKVVLPGKLKRVVNPSFGDSIVETTAALPITLPSRTYSFFRPVLLSCVPVVGPLILSYNSYVLKGSNSQARFNRLTKLRERQVRYLIKEREGEYFTFGFISNFLENIPILGTFFFFTNVVGGALLCIDYYKHGRTGF